MHIGFRRVKATFPPEVMEEHARIAKEYNRQYFIRTNRLKHDIANKIWMKNEAYKALPAELQPAANKPDLNHKPRDAPTPPLYFTPPIKGFDVKKYVSNSEDSNTDDEDFNQ